MLTTFSRLLAFRRSIIDRPAASCAPAHRSNIITLSDSARNHAAMVRSFFYLIGNPRTAYETHRSGGSAAGEILLARVSIGKK